MGECSIRMCLAMVRAFCLHQNIVGVSWWERVCGGGKITVQQEAGEVKDQGITFHVTEAILAPLIIT